MIVEILLQIVVASFVLVLLGGASQALPLGIGSASQLRQVSGQVAPEFGANRDKVMDVSSAPVVTDEFERLAVNQVTTLTTDRSFSWIVSKPIGYYKPGRYLGLEVLTQLLVAVGIVSIHATLGEVASATKVGIAVIAALLASIAAYGQLVNWWGLTFRYAVGVSATMVVGWGVSMALITFIWP